MIGVFDSGFGGLTVLKEFLNLLPDYNYVYLGDNARAPYGDKSQEAIYQYTREAVDFLFQNGCELVIVACNTASAEALRRIQQEYLSSKHPDKRVLGVIIPIAEEMANIKEKTKIGLIGTKATIDSGAYEREIEKINKNISLFKQSCPLLVPLVEEGWANKPEAKKILRHYLRPLKDKKIKGLILGCTHYPILLKNIRGVVGKRVKIFNTAEIVAQKLKLYLEKHAWLDKKLSKNREKIFFTTDNPDKFKIMGEKFLKKKIDKVNKVKI